MHSIEWIWARTPRRVESRHHQEIPADGRPHGVCTSLSGSFPGAALCSPGALLARSRREQRRRPSAAAIALLAGLVSLAGFAQAPHGQVTPGQAPPAQAQRFVVVLDAAHGGGDAGARLGSETEKDYTLAFSGRLRSLLTARGMAVVMTRESDAAMDADRRAEIANSAKAQACLSLHATESGWGVHLFVSSQAPAQRMVLSPWKTAQAVWIPRSLALAGVVNAALSHAGISVTLGRTALPGVDSMSCPAVAVEISPERSPDGAQAAGLDDADYQARVAMALAAALVEWRWDHVGGKQP